MQEIMWQGTAIELVKEAIAKGEECPLFPIGSCMTPLICHKDRVIVKRPATDDIQLGDIVLYQVSSDQLFVHRIIHKTVDDGQVTLLTKADSLLLAELPITPDRILAKVTAVEKTSRTIRLDTRLSRFLNRWLARYSYAIHVFSSQFRFLKSALSSNKKCRVSNLAQKVFQKVSSSLARFLINLTFLSERR